MRSNSPSSPAASGPGGRTSAFISHRFKSIREADRVLVLADGQIVESGSHAALTGPLVGTCDCSTSRRRNIRMISRTGTAGTDDGQ
jgi:hypothetical protein